MQVFLHASRSYDQVALTKPFTHADSPLLIPQLAVFKTMTSFPDVARAHFPSLLSGFVFAENAGRSQCAELVAKRISDYFLNTNVQQSTDYSISDAIPWAYSQLQSFLTRHY